MKNQAKFPGKKSRFARRQRRHDRDRARFDRKRQIRDQREAERLRARALIESLIAGIELPLEPLGQACFVGERSGEVSFVTPRAGARVETKCPVKVQIRGTAVDGPGVSTALLVDRGPMVPGIEAQAERPILLPPGTTEVDLLLEPGRRILCAQLVEPSGKALGIFEVIEVRVG
jgi:hypothetical protein